jgi:hypothetical protein
MSVVEAASGWENEKTNPAADDWVIEDTGEGRKLKGEGGKDWADAWDQQEGPVNRDKDPSVDAAKPGEGDSQPIPAGNQTEGIDIINLAIDALEQHDKRLFMSLLDPGCYKQVEEMGDDFEMTSPSGKAKAATLAEVFKQARVTSRNQEIIYYETTLEDETYLFHVIFDQDADAWKLGGL